jgi:PAS domain S-box-containing protein
MKARLRFSPRGIVVTYALVAGLWIAFSDRVATALAPSVDALAAISTLKGLAFVLVTSGLLAIMLIGYEAERARRTDELEAHVAERVRAEAHLGRLNRVLRTLSLANEALVRTQEEPDLLRAFCATIIEQGAFLGAWVGYKQPAPDSTIRPVAWAGPLEGFLDAFEVSWLDEDRGSAGPAGTSIREARTIISMDVATDETLVFRAPMIERGWRSLAALPLRIDADVIGTLVIYAGEPDSFGSDEIALLESLAEDLSYGIGALRTRATAARGEFERRRLAVAIEQSPDAIVITDTMGAIEYVNPAFESSTGYSADEVLGKNPRILQSGLQTPAFYVAMWETLTAGHTWTSDMINRRKDGTLFTEAASISPVHDPAGDTLGYVAVKRDVSRQRAAESRAVTQARERTLIAAALATVRPGSSLEQTTAALCTQIARLPDVALATLLTFDQDGRAAPLGAVASDGTSLERRRLSDARSRHLRARAREGPWIEGLAASSGSASSREFRARAVRALAYVPLVIEGTEVGLLEVGSSEEGSTERLAGQLSALVEFGGIAGALLGPALVARAQVADARARIRGILENHSYDPVFQPIIDLETKTAVGYEALTRFADGTPPDQQFASATAQGMAAELEAATLRAALAAARGLPPRVWLSVNVSPPFVLAGEPLRAILQDAPRPLVLEVTEEQAIPDYPSFRAAIASFRTDLRLAVDDAGAGFASLRHISELRPALVKLDRALVADIDADPVRQALVAGMHHFAETVDCSLIAEGIETDAELATLRALGVRFGQGYLLGRPAPLPPNPQNA